MTVTLIKDGVPVPNTPINNASVSNPTALTFAAPAVPNNSLNQQNCSSGGPINGLKYVPTSFGIRVRNTLTGCSVDLPNVLVYYPIDTTCRAALQIITPSLPNGTAGAAYSAQFIASGGAGAPYSWSAVGLPAALVLNAANGHHLGHARRGGHVHHQRHGRGRGRQHHDPYLHAAGQLTPQSGLRGSGRLRAARTVSEPDAVDSETDRITWLSSAARPSPSPVSRS